MLPIDVPVASKEANDFMVFLLVEEFSGSARTAGTTFIAEYWPKIRNPITTGETEINRHPLHLQFRKNERNV